MLLIGLPALAVAIAVAVWLVARHVEDNGALATMARLIGGEVDHGAARATGQLDGHRVTVENFSNETTHWTEVTAEVTAELATALDLEVRVRSDAEDRAIAAGQAIDVELGDPEFQAAYVAEGAPAAQVRATLTVAVRAALIELAPIRVELHHGALRLISPRLIRDDASATTLIALTRGLIAGVDRRAPADALANPGGDRADAERARLSEARTSRSDRNHRAGLIVLGVIAVIAIAIGVAMVRRFGPPTP